MTGCRTARRRGHRPTHSGSDDGAAASRVPDGPAEHGHRAHRLAHQHGLLDVELLEDAVAIGISLGVASAIRGGVAARALDGIALVAMAVPSFWFAAILVYLFVIELPWFPASGYVALTSSPSMWLKSLALPVICLATSAVAGLALQMRGQMVATFQTDYVRALRANGLPNRSVLYRHVLKNASGPVITVSGLLVVTLLGGTVLMETIFGMAGLGTLAVQATARHDLPVIQGVVVYFTIIVIIVNLLTDLAQAAVNPRVAVE